MTQVTERDKSWAQTCANDMHCFMCVIIRDGEIDVIEENQVNFSADAVIFTASPEEN